MMDDRALRLKWLGLGYLYCLKMSKVEGDYFHERGKDILSDLRRGNLNGVPANLDDGILMMEYGDSKRRCSGHEADKRRLHQVLA